MVHITEPPICALLHTRSRLNPNSDATKRLLFHSSQGIWQHTQVFTRKTRISSEIGQKGVPLSQLFLPHLENIACVWVCTQELFLLPRHLWMLVCSKRYLLPSVLIGDKEGGVEPKVNDKHQGASNLILSLKLLSLNGHNQIWQMGLSPVLIFTRLTCKNKRKSESRCSGCRKVWPSQLLIQCAAVCGLWPKNADLGFTTRMVESFLTNKGICVLLHLSALTGWVRVDVWTALRSQTVPIRATLSGITCFFASLWSVFG